VRGSDLVAAVLQFQWINYLVFALICALVLPRIPTRVKTLDGRPPLAFALLLAFVIIVPALVRQALGLTATGGWFAAHQSISRPLLYIPHFIMGMAVAGLFISLRKWRAVCRIPGMVVAWSLLPDVLCAAIVWLVADPRLPQWNTLVDDVLAFIVLPTLFCLMVLALALQRPGEASMVRTVLEWSPVTFVGELSLSIYLFHGAATALWVRSVVENWPGFIPPADLPGLRDPLDWVEEKGQPVKLVLMLVSVLVGWVVQRGFQDNIVVPIIARGIRWPGAPPAARKLVSRDSSVLDNV
jgi:peptidoglycan/LPS O-acetylase OafA/YrhL